MLFRVNAATSVKFLVLKGFSDAVCRFTVEYSVHRIRLVFQGNNVEIKCKKTDIYISILLVWCYWSPSIQIQTPVFKGKVNINILAVFTFKQDLWEFESMLMCSYQWSKTEWRYSTYQTTCRLKHGLNDTVLTRAASQQQNADWFLNLNGRTIPLKLIIINDERLQLIPAICMWFSDVITAANITCSIYGSPAGA